MGRVVSRFACYTPRERWQMARHATIAHLSDLHFGLGARVESRARDCVRALRARRVDHVVVTGDVTHRGLEEEYEAFLDVFDPLLAEGRLTVVPGNHDRPGDDVADSITDGERVRVTLRDGLYLVGLDSTGPHNRVVWQGHGMVTDGDLRAIDEALHAAPPDRLVAVLMHHHPVPLPEEGAIEMLSSWVGLPFTEELHCGTALLDVVRGRADLVLHGHRHQPSARWLADPSPARRSLGIFNAGSTTGLGRFRVFEHRGRVLLDPPQWVTPASSPHGAATAHGWGGWRPPSSQTR